MDASWAVTLAATLALIAIMCAKGSCSGAIWQAQSASAVMALGMVFLYYCPACSQGTYEWIAFLTDGTCSALDIWLAIQILCAPSKANWLATVTVSLIVFNQWVKLHWHQRSDLFHLPVGEDAYWIPLRFWANLTCVLGMALLVHFESGYMPARRHNEQT